MLRRFGQSADRFADCLGRRVQRDAASQYLEGLFNDSERKSIQAMHARLTEGGTYQRLQHFITHSPWDAARTWTRLREVVPDREGILALDDTGLPKQGKHSVGVQRQYSGTLGKIGNCQIAVSSALIGATGVWPLTCELYLPAAWIADPARRAEAGIPESARFREKWRIALAHVRAVLRAGFTLAAVVADADYGRSAPFRRGLERLGLRYALAVRGDQVARLVGASRSVPLAALAAQVPERAWQRVSWAAGTKGPLAARFVALRVRPRRSGGDRWLLCERSLVDDERKYYFLNLDATASLIDLARLARSRWPIEQQYRELKDELGFDHFEGRSLQGWTHHAVLTAMAFTFLQMERSHVASEPRPTLPQVRAWLRDVVGVLYVLGNRQLFNLMVSFVRNPPQRR